MQSKQTAGLALGLYRIADVLDEMRDIYKNGLDKGDSPGFQKLSEHYRVKRGMVTIVTGIPSSGKSEVIDAIAVNLAANCSWKFAFFSPENYPISLHVIKIAE